jgi:hypothetical protein
VSTSKKKKTTKHKQDKRQKELYIIKIVIGIIIIIIPLTELKKNYNIYSYEGCSYYFHGWKSHGW